ncbi:MAG: ABC transporter ATP-binding protein, partial [Methylophilaceae bacterium]
MALLELHNVTRRFGDFVAIDNVSLAIEAGEFFTLLGPSGCGKTTILRMIAGFDLPDEGQILLDCKDLAGTAPEDRPVHTLFQSYALFPHRSVAQNIAFPLAMSGKPLGEIQRRLQKTLEEVHLLFAAGLAASAGGTMGH